MYRNPTPHLTSVHAYFPSVAVMPGGDLLATIVLGEAFEAVNLRTHITRSRDDGETWTPAVPLIPVDTDSRTISNASRLSVLPGGETVILTALFDRSDHPGCGLANPDTYGFVKTDFVTFRSSDSGYSWNGPYPVDHPLGETPLELCAPVTPVGGGRCLIPTSTWNTWDGGGRYGFRMIALISRDNGVTWPNYVDVMADSKGDCVFWESKIATLPDGRLLATAWVHDRVQRHDLLNHYALGDHNGHSWTESMSTGLIGQTLTPCILEDGRIVSVYRRTDKPGLWANVSRIDGDRWLNDCALPLWGYDDAVVTAVKGNAMVNFTRLRFGAPSVITLPGGDVYVAFWCYEDCVSVIRWFRFTVK